MELTERVLMVLIGAVCVFCVAGLMMGWTAENFLLIISFVVGTFFPSLIEKTTAFDRIKEE